MENTPVPSLVASAGDYKILFKKKKKKRYILLQLVVSYTPPCVTDREPFFFSFFSCSLCIGWFEGVIVVG